MQTAKFKVDYGAKLQVESLTPREKAALTTLLSARDPAGSVQVQRLSSGEFTARLGGTRRVLWRQTPSGPLVLGVIDQSYAA